MRKTKLFNSEKILLILMNLFLFDIVIFDEPWNLSVTVLNFYPGFSKIEFPKAGFISIGYLLKFFFADIHAVKDSIEVCKLLGFTK